MTFSKLFFVGGIIFGKVMAGIIKRGCVPCWVLFKAMVFCHGFF
jgi:hypothetical protein